LLRAPSGQVVEAVRKLGLEGVVGKRIDSIYEPGERSGAWIKHRTNQEQEFVIGGYIPGARGFDALLVGVYEQRARLRCEGEEWLFAANSGRSLPGSPKAESCPLPVHKPAREKSLTVGRIANRRENGAMPLGHTEAGLPGGIRRMDGCRALAALHLRRHAR
jgi:ATP-dependent DNA ligase